MKAKKLSGSSSPSRTYLFAFGYTTGWWNRWFPGFTHVAIGEITPLGNMLVNEPMIYRCVTEFRPMLTEEDELDERNIAVLEVIISNRPRINRLFKLQFQTCATVVQYLSGISLGVITVNGLYKRLTTKSEAWLLRQGVIGVRKWEKPSQPPLHS